MRFSFPLSIIAALLVTTSSHALDCRISEDTVGFKDLEAIKMAISATKHKRATGDAGLQELAFRRFATEGRLNALEEGDKVTLIGVDQWHNISILLVKTKDKLECWIAGESLRCKKQK